MNEKRPFKVTCKCGAKTMNFKNNIGSYFIDECCRIAGYDNLGLKKGEKPEPPVITKAATKLDSPSDALDKRKAEKLALQESRAAEISARQAERDSRAKEKAERAQKLAEGTKQDASS